MDVLGHLLLGVAVSGKADAQTIVASLLPDIAALPLQFNNAWKNPSPKQLTFYKLCHSPLFLFLAWFLPGSMFVVVAAHIIADMFTHKQPYSDFPIFQWQYGELYYNCVLLILAGIACLRLFY